MKRKIIGIIVVLCTLVTAMAQDVLVIPYDATSLTDEQRNANPTYMVYPKSLEGKDSVILLCVCIEAVDLGLSVKWGTCNIGATRPEDYGLFFAWGETESKEDYWWTNYRYCNQQDEFYGGGMTKYCTNAAYGLPDSLNTLLREDDAASTHWQENWRIPTYEEGQELCQQCTWEWKERNGIYGFEVTGPNGNSIFMPTAGLYKEDSPVTTRPIVVTDPRKFNYWLSSLGVLSPYAYEIWNQSGDTSQPHLIVANTPRYIGMPIRPVCP